MKNRTGMGLLNKNINLKQKKKGKPLMLRQNMKPVLILNDNKAIQLTVESIN